MYILVVDDDPFGSNLIQFMLNREGYQVETLDNARNALQMIQKREPDLLILDVRMPYMNGFELAARLRAEGYEMPLIFLTAEDTIDSKLKGFSNQADDYICKPYNPQELLARVEAVLRRAKKQQTKLSDSHLRVGQIELYPTELQVVIPEKPTIVLTRTEMQVLRILMTYSHRVVTREQLLGEVWNDSEGSSNIVDVYVRRLRAKLEENADKPQHIVSVRGIGYKFIA